MFNVGDKLKVRMSEAERQYAGCKGTTVYNNMIKLAMKKRYFVLAVDSTTYTLKDENGTAFAPALRQDIEQMFEQANE